MQAAGRQARGRPGRGGGEGGQRGFYFLLGHFYCAPLKFPPAIRGRSAIARAMAKLAVAGGVARLAAVDSVGGVQVLDQRRQRSRWQRRHLPLRAKRLSQLRGLLAGHRNAAKFCSWLTTLTEQCWTTMSRSKRVRCVGGSASVLSTSTSLAAGRSNGIARGHA